jgi:N-acyl-D-aspartate/D-glutamate deacylase
MQFDLVIRRGTIVDGSGLAPYRADVAVRGDRIAAIGRIEARGAREIDADGLVVTPGFIDGHTHMDAQIFWDPLGTSSCWHGVTSVMMGNCGFTLAPARADAHGLVIDNLERAEDIPAATMAAGIDWSWESFPEYLDAVDALPKAINYAAQIGHSALRTFAMGERAFDEVAEEDDLAQMAATLREALDAGAVGFSTSVSDHHFTPSGRPVASRVGNWQEVCLLVETLARHGGGIFQLAVETALTESDDVEVARSFYDRLRALAVSSRVPTTYGLRREHLQVQLDTFDKADAAGGRMFGQCRSNAMSGVFCFKTRTPYDGLASWATLRAAPRAVQLARLADPAVRAELARDVAAAYDDPASRLPRFTTLKVMREGHPDVSLADLAAARRLEPMEALFDLVVESGLEQVFGRFASAADEEEMLVSMRHPRTIMTFSDAGAHVSHHSGADLQTTLLAHWVRERQLFSLAEAVRMVTLAPALAFGIADRGLVREGLIADLNVFDPAEIAPGTPAVVEDLPAGAPRILQRARGIHATVVAGVQVFADGVHTGELPGQLLRGRRIA